MQVLGESKPKVLISLSSNKTLTTLEEEDDEGCEDSFMGTAESEISSFM
jgi:hypothetical protein